MPLFTHDCDVCKFLGTWVELDVYVCSRTGSIIARFGNDGPEYTSMQLSFFQHQLRENTMYDAGGGKIPMDELIKSGRAEYLRAWTLALSANFSMLTI